MSAAERYAQTIALFCQHVIRRIPPVVKMPAPPKPDKPANNNSRDSKKAIQTRKGRYGESKMKRNTREDKKKSGHKLTKENK